MIQKKRCWLVILMLLFLGGCATAAFPATSQLTPAQTARATSPPASATPFPDSSILLPSPTPFPLAQLPGRVFFTRRVPGQEHLVQAILLERGRLETLPLTGRRITIAPRGEFLLSSLAEAKGGLSFRLLDLEGSSLLGWF
jgi:hypothetical protein